MRLCYTNCRIGNTTLYSVVLPTQQLHTTSKTMLVEEEEEEGHQTERMQGGPTSFWQLQLISAYTPAK